MIFATYLILGCLAFWFSRSSAAIKIGYDVHLLVQYPVNIYSGAIKIFLTFIFPYIFTNYYPISVLLGKEPVVYGIISPFACIFMLYLSLLFWKLGLKSYQGSGS